MMMNELDKNPEWKTQENDSVDWVGVFSYALAWWPWFAASVCICLTVSFLYLRYTSPVYNIAATVMIKDEKKGGNAVSELSAFDGMGLFSTGSSFDNEVEMIKSKSLLKKVVYEMKAYATYRVKDGFSTYDLYGNSPVAVEMPAGDNDLMKGFLELELSFTGDSVLAVSGIYKTEDEIPFEGKLKTFPAILDSPAGKLTFSMLPDKPFVHETVIHVTVNSSMDVAQSWYNLLNIVPTSKTTSVARLTFRDTNKKRGEDFLNKLIEMYNRFTNSDKNLVGVKTEQFINERIAIISGELGSTEQELESFKRLSKLTNLDQVAGSYLKESAEYEQRMIENNMQINLVTSLNDFVNDPKNKDSVIPANIGLKDNILAALINHYNEQVLERERLMRVSSLSNPVILRLNAGIEGLRSNVKASIGSVLEGLKITRRDLNIQAGRFSNLISGAPEQERILTNITRQQEIKSGLYLMLLQKREENSIAMAATIDNAKIIDPAMADHDPVAPKGKIILLSAFMLGIMIPATFLYVRNHLLYKIDTGEDVKKLSTLPVLDDIPYVNSGSPIVVKVNENTRMTEAFRGLRTNLQFMLGDVEKKVIVVTSIKPGEGKTFIAVNTAISLALLKKKVLLIGLDIRLPRLEECFPASGRKEGITSYLSGSVKELSSLIVPSGVVPSLEILFAGRIPPNPAELLAGSHLDEAIRKLRQDYDYIIIDTAPVGLVSDTLILDRVADLTLCVSRSKYTHKKEIGSLNILHKEKKLNNMCLVVNAVKWKSKRYGYYGGYGGNYGYGHYGKYDTE